MGGNGDLQATAEIPFPIVVGCGRSGTTLLKRILTTHPALAVTPESYFMVSLGKRQDSYGKGGAFDSRKLVRDLFAQRHFVQWWHLSEEDVLATLERAGPEDYPSAIRALSAEFARRQEKVRYGNKTPTFVRHMPFLSRLWPESRFIHIIRDGRDVALSYLEIDFGPDSVLEGALLWRQRVSDGRRDGGILGPDRYMEVLYEDLVGEPERTVRAVCRFAGLDFDPAMLRYFETHEPKSGGYHRHLAKPPTKVREWRNQLSREDALLFEAVAGDLLAQVGYDRSTAATPLRTRLRAAGGAAALRLERRARRVKSGIRRRLPR